MMSRNLFNLRAFIVFAVAYMLVEQGRAELPRNMSCFQCRVQRNEDCSDPTFLKPCPAGAGAFDRCMTTISKRDGQTTITKSCTLAPCEMAYVGGLPAGLPCDTTRDEYTCVHCCREDGCNADAAGSGRPAVATVLCFGLLVFLPAYVILDSLQHGVGYPAGPAAAAGGAIFRGSRVG